MTHTVRTAGTDPSRGGGAADEASASAAAGANNKSSGPRSTGAVSVGLDEGEAQTRAAAPQAEVAPGGWPGVGGGCGSEGDQGGARSGGRLRESRSVHQLGRRLRGVRREHHLGDV